LFGFSEFSANSLVGKNLTWYDWRNHIRCLSILVWTIRTFCPRNNWCVWWLALLQNSWDVDCCPLCALVSLSKPLGCRAWGVTWVTPRIIGKNPGDNPWIRGVSTLLCTYLVPTKGQQSLLLSAVALDIES
jgi:hypothetical protein